MKQDNQRLYYALTADKKQSLFSRPAWMDAATVGKKWNVIFLGKGDGKPSSADEVAVAMPYHVFRKYGLCQLCMPQLTQHIEPVVAEGVNEAEVMPRLVKQLDAVCRRKMVVCAVLHGDWSEAMRDALQADGYTVSQRVTYRLPKGLSREEVVARYSENKKRQLKRAEGMHLVELKADAFYDLHAAWLKERGLRISYEKKLAKSVLKKEWSKVLAAANEEGEVYAAVGLVYDHERCYYLLPTYDPHHNKSGAMAWLTTEAIMWAMEKGLEFDFEGSMVTSIARSYKEFGGEPAIYYRAEKFVNPIAKWFFNHRPGKKG